MLFQHNLNTDLEEPLDLKDEVKEETSKTELKEEFELDLDKNRFETINVPERGASRFVHDFYSVSDT